MTALPPSAESLSAYVSAFERDLAAARTAREAQSVRDKYLGRKNSIVASWMQSIAGAQPDRKQEIGRYANDLKQAIETRWNAHEATARDEEPAGAVDVTLPGRQPQLGHRHTLTVVRSAR